MSRSSGRGQVEPVAALVVLLAVCAAVSTYAVAVDGSVRESDRDLASPTLDRVVDVLAADGVADPARTKEARRAEPAGHRLNVTVARADRRWHAGPTPAEGAETDVATRTVGVRLDPGRVRPGRVRVEVWT